MSLTPPAQHPASVPQCDLAARVSCEGLWSPCLCSWVWSDVPEVGQQEEEPAIHQEDGLVQGWAEDLEALTMTSVSRGWVCASILPSGNL